jgi:hypothetical protein
MLPTVRLLSSVGPFWIFLRLADFLIIKRYGQFRTCLVPIIHIMSNYEVVGQFEILAGRVAFGSTFSSKPMTSSTDQM